MVDSGVMAWLLNLTDLILERDDGQVIAFEIKAAAGWAVKTSADSES